MKAPSGHVTILCLTIPLALGMAWASLTGLSVEGFYGMETANWQLQSKAQDKVDLYLILPMLLITSFFAYKGNMRGLTLWTGINLYVLYTFVIYAFDIHFNQLFMVYCMNLGLSFYSIAYSLFVIKGGTHIRSVLNRKLVKAASVYFIIAAVAFYGLWLTEIIQSAGSGQLPKSLLDAGTPTNPVHVIDLSVFLPGVFITGIFLWKNNIKGMILAPVMLTFFILMNITIAVIQWEMLTDQLTSNVMIIAVMACLTLFSMYFLFHFLQSIQQWKSAELAIKAYLS